MTDAPTVYEPGTFCPMFDGDVDSLLEYLADLTGESRRRTAPAGGRLPRRATATDRRQPPAQPRIDLILYMSAESEKSRRALRAVRDVLKDYDARQVKFSTCDLSVRPQDGEADSVLFTPTLVTQGQGPRTAIIGNLEDRDVLRDLLDANGVDRRWDD